MGIEGLPLPAQLGVIGALILTIVSVLVYQNRLVQKGKLIPRDVHLDALAAKDKEYDRMVELKDERIKEIAEAKGEWHGAHEASEAGRTEEREINRQNSDAMKTVAYFFREIAPKREIPDILGDNAGAGGKGR